MYLFLVTIHSDQELPQYLVLPHALQDYEIMNPGRSCGSAAVRNHDAALCLVKLDRKVVLI